MVSIPESMLTLIAENPVLVVVAKKFRYKPNAYYVASSLSVINQYSNNVKLNLLPNFPPYSTVISTNDVYYKNTAGKNRTELATSY